MENATKALAMAGGVLIAIVTIAALIFVYNQIKEAPKQMEEKKYEQQLTKFNKEYESYEKKLMRGTDVVSVINKAINNNNANVDDIDSQIQVVFTILDDIKAEDNTTILCVAGEYYQDSKQYKDICNDEEALKALRRAFFKCIGIEYNSAGRVNKIKFQQVRIDADGKIVE